MDKCQHNQKITVFCITQSCAWKQAGGCNTCIKKYHSHIGPTNYVNQKEIESLLKKYKTQTYTKPKVKLLEQSIHNYFNNVKGQILYFIDEIDKKIRTELCYPFLVKNGTINIYKKVKKHQFKKLNQREFRSFYQLTNKLKIEDIMSQEKKLYDQIVKRYSKVFRQISSIFKTLESQTRNIENINHLKFQEIYSHKVNELFQSIISENVKQFHNSQVQKNPQKRSFEPMKYHQNHDERIRPSNQKSFLKLVTNDAKSENYSSKIAQLKKQKKQKLEPKQFISTKKDDELNEMKKKLLNMMGSQEKHRPTTLSPFQMKVFEMKHKQQTKQSQELKDDELVKKSSTLVSSHMDSLEKYSEKKNTSKRIQNQSINQSGNSSISLNLADNFLKVPLPKQQFINHSQLPLAQQNIVIHLNQQELIPNKHRAMVIPVKRQFNIQTNDTSPIGKRKKQLEELQIEMEVVEQMPGEYILTQKQIPLKVNLTDNQQKSIVLLNQSLMRNAQDAIPILRRSIQFAPNNLSAVQYLSFLLLQTNQPLECLKVCNKVLQLLEGQVVYDINSIHIHNNKAVALIQLGRFSESIPLLEKCIQVKQFDRFYKNLGDAYYLIGIYQKSIYNYQKSISLNNKISEPYYNLSVCYFTQQNYTNALIFILKALEIQSNKIQYIQLANQIRQRL